MATPTVGTNAKKIPIHFQSAQNRVLIKGGRCVNDDQEFDADVYCEDGIIKEVGKSLIVPGGARVIDARGHYVLPGGIDANTHFQLPMFGTRTVDDFYQGTKAAVAGGTTMIIDFATPDPPHSSILSAYEKWRSWADEKVCCDYGLHVVVGAWKESSSEKEMEMLVRDKGVNSFKFYMVHDYQLKDQQLMSAFETCKRLGAVPMVHAENREIIDYLTRKLLKMGITGPEGIVQSRPEQAEAEATQRAITLANQVNCPLYLSHLMCKSAAEVVARERNKGAVVVGETIAAAIGTDGTHYFNKCWRHAAGHVTSPPLRPDRSTADALLDMLYSGALQIVSSDHCVTNSKQKAIGSDNFSKIPPGLNGVEERLMVLWEKGVRTGRLSPSQFVAVTSTNTAKVFNIYPRKGRIQVGSDADLVVWGINPKLIKAETHNSSVDFNIFEGMQVQFSPLYVVSNGRVVLDPDGMHVAQGFGRYVPMPPSSQVLYKLIDRREKITPIRIDRSAEAVKPTTLPVGAAAPQLPQQPAAAPAAPSSVASAVEPNVRPSLTPSDVASSPSAIGRTKSGVRNMQESTFKLTGEQVDDDQLKRTGIRVHNPPGGKSSGLW